jgi:hypothetical protein
MNDIFFLFLKGMLNTEKKNEKEANRQVMIAMH